jgi:hypothetical protein
VSQKLEVLEAEVRVVHESHGVPEFQEGDEFQEAYRFQ